MTNVCENTFLQKLFKLISEMAEDIFVEGLYSLSGKVALVAGGGTGIGRAMAEAIAKA